MGYSKSSPKREVYSNTILPQETRKTSQIDRLTLHLKQLEKEKQKTPKIGRGKEIKIWAETKGNERNNSKV